METGSHLRSVSSPITDRTSLLAISAALSRDLAPAALGSPRPQVPSTTTVKVEDDSSVGAVSSVHNVSFPRVPEPDVPEAILLPVSVPQIQTVDPPFTEVPLVDQRELHEVLLSFDATDDELPPGADPDQLLGCKITAHDVLCRVPRLASLNKHFPFRLLKSVALRLASIAKKPATGEMQHPREGSVFLKSWTFKANTSAGDSVPGSKCYRLVRAAAQPMPTAPASGDVLEGRGARCRGATRRLVEAEDGGKGAPPAAMGLAKESKPAAALPRPKPTAEPKAAQDTQRPSCQTCKTTLWKNMLHCASCGDSWHARCLGVPLKAVSKGDWHCEACQKRLQKYQAGLNKIPCKVCRSPDDPPAMLLCDGCDGGWHLKCLTPPLLRVPRGDWFCKACMELRQQAKDIEKNEAKGKITYSQTKKVTASQRAAALALSRAQAQVKSRRLAEKAACDAPASHQKRKASAPEPDEHASKAARAGKQETKVDPPPPTKSKAAPVPSPEPARKRGRSCRQDWPNVTEPLDQERGLAGGQIGPELQLDGGVRRQSMRLTGAAALKASCKINKGHQLPASQTAMMQEFERRWDESKEHIGRVEIQLQDVQAQVKQAGIKRQEGRSEGSQEKHLRDEIVRIQGALDDLTAKVGALTDAVNALSPPAKSMATACQSQRRTQEAGPELERTVALLKSQVQQLMDNKQRSPGAEGGIHLPQQVGALETCGVSDVPSPLRQPSNVLVQQMQCMQNQLVTEKLKRLEAETQLLRGQNQLNLGLHGTGGGMIPMHSPLQSQSAGYSAYMEAAGASVADAPLLGGQAAWMGFPQDFSTAQGSLASQEMIRLRAQNLDIMRQIKALQGGLAAQIQGDKQTQQQMTGVAHQMLCPPASSTPLATSSMISTMPERPPAVAQPGSVGPMADMRSATPVTPNGGNGYVLHSNP